MNMAEMGLEPVTTGICNWRNRVQGSVCTAAIPSRSCPLWVKSRHRGTSNQCPLYPQKRTSELSLEMSALCQKRTSHGPSGENGEPRRDDFSTAHYMKPHRSN